MDVVVLVAQLVAVVLSFVFVVYVARQKQSFLCMYLLVYSAAVFLNALGYLYELKSKILEEALMAIRFEYLGLAVAAVSAVFFICELFDVRLRLWMRALYVLAFCTTFTLLVTNHRHHLHYKSCYLEVRELISVFHSEIGISYLIHTVLMLSSIGICVAIIIRAWLKDAKRRKNYTKYLFLGIAALMPLLFWGMHFVGPMKEYDLIPFGLFCSNACFILIIYHFRIFNVAESAKNEVLESLEEGILVCDEDGSIVYTNATVREIFKNSRLKKISEVLRLLVPTEDGDYFIDGRYYAVTESEVYEGTKVKGKTLCFIDMTQTKEKERQLKELHDAALAANNAKSSFLANMSHEIRTPINTILGMDELILRESGDSNILGYAENIKMEGRTLMSLINDVLDFSKIESGKMEISEANYSIASLLHDVIAMFSIKAEEKGLDFRVNVSEDIPAVLYGDEIRIKQVLSNILSNAVKYTERGAIWLNAECRKQDDRGAELVVSVRDSGIGIRREDLDVIFEKFKRLDTGRTARIEGTGLGMSITAQLLELMHGEISIESEYGIGSEFKVRIPQQIVDRTPIGNYNYPAREIKKKEAHTTFTAPDAKILVVDDNVMNRVVVKGLLKRTLLQIDEAASGFECLQRTEKTRYDVILLDHMMPGMDGIETLQRLKKQDGACKDAVVIVLTANAVAGVREVYLEKGFEDYLSKPISGTLLEETLLKYLPEHLVLKKKFTSDETASEEEKTPEEPIDRRTLLAAAGINMEGSLEHFGGDETMYRDAARMFVSLREERMSKLHGYIRAEDAISYVILAHAVKGDARMLGAPVLAEIAYEQEKMGKEGNLSFLRDRFGLFSAEYQRVAECFERIYGTAEEKNDSVEGVWATGEPEAEKKPMVSYETGLKYFDGHEDIYRETLLLFTELWEEREEMLTTLLAQENMKDYSILIHAIKGDARTLGAEELAELAYEQEMQAKAGETDNVRNGFSHVIQVGKQTVEYIRAGLVSGDQK
ncbi:MAG: response regulator [Lachnospiraceae bacterium]|nr:response regulator [Lachnospiraceae bacterium]